MLKDVFTLVSLPTLAYVTVVTGKNFSSSLGAQLWDVGFISVLFGLWFGMTFPQEVWNIYAWNKIRLFFPAVILASITVPLLGFQLGIGLTALGFIAFWVTARGTESVISGGWHRNQPPYGPRRI